MSSLAPDLATKETGEPKVTNETPESRTVEAVTLDLRFIQQDRMNTEVTRWVGSDKTEHVNTGFTYERSCERYRAGGGLNGERHFAGRPEAQISQTISTYEGTTFDTKIETEVSGNGLGGSATYLEQRYPHGTFDMNETQVNFYVRAGTGGTALPDGICSVSATEEIRVYHPDEPKFRETRTEGHYRIERRSGGWKGISDNQVADVEVIDIEIDRSGAASGSSRIITDALKPSGWMVLSPDSFHDPINYSPEEAGEVWNDLRTLVESARAAVKNRPDSRLIFEPQNQYLIPGGLTAKPERPLQDFQAKEILRSI